MATSQRRLTAAIALGIAFSFIPTAQAQQYRFEVIAGAFDGDGGPASQASLGGPSGVAFNSSGEMYITEGRRSRIRKIGTDGIIVPVLGSGVPGYADPTHVPGDPNVLGRTNSPQGVLFDRLGNMYFAEQSNHRVRKLHKDGSVTLVAGNGTAAFSGDGGRAVDAGIGWPYGLALDSVGNLYISDYGNHRVRKVTPGGVISTVAGNGAAESSGDGGPAVQASLKQPFGIAIDPQNNLLIAENGSGRLRKVAGGQISTLDTFDGLNDVSSDASGNLYVSHYCAISKMAVNGATQIFAQDPKCDWLSFPEKVAFSRDGTPYFADSSTGFVYRKGAGDAQPVAVAGRRRDFGDGGPAVDASLSGVNGVSVDAAGRLCVADLRNNLKIRGIDTDGKISTIAGNGLYSNAEPDHMPATQVGFIRSYDCKRDGSGNTYIVNFTELLRVSPAGIIRRVAGSLAGGYAGDGGPAIQARFRSLRRAAVDAVGNLYISDYGNSRVRKVNTAGIITTVAGNGINDSTGDDGFAVNASVSPYAVAVDAAGNLFIADRNNHRVRKVTPVGFISTVMGDGQPLNAGDGGLAVNASVYAPTGIAVAANGDLFVTAAGALRRVSAATGRISTIGGLDHPVIDVSIGSDNAIYVANGGGRVLKGVPAPGVR